MAKNNPDVVAHTCNPIYTEGKGRVISIQGLPQEIAQDSIWNIAKGKKSWRWGSRVKVLA
jgi:hypothetical protein